MLNWKKIFLIFGFITLTIFLGYLLYFFFFRPLAPARRPVNLNIPLGGLPLAEVGANIPVREININGQLIPVPPEAKPPVAAIAQGGLTQTQPVTDNTVSGMVLGAAGSGLLYYDKNKEKFFKLTSTGEINPLSDEIFYQVQKITWAPIKNQAILEYPDNSKILYDFSTKKQVTLPKHWQDFDFSPDSNQIVFKSLGEGEENRWLAVAKADGTGAEKIEHLGNKDATVYPMWSPNKQIIATFRENVGADKQNLYFLGLHNENFKLLTLPGRGFEGKWSTDGENLLFSVYSEASNFKPTLWIASAAGENIGETRINLGLETWADKCSFASPEILYCAVPQRLETGAGIFREEMDNSPTDIYKIDLKTGFKNKIAQPEGDYNISNLVIAGDGLFLYFTDKNYGKIYKIRLKE